MAKGKKDEMLIHLLSSRFTVIDLETTGRSSAKGAEIIEIGACKIDVNEPRARCFKTFVKPKLCKHIPSFIVDLTGIHDEEVANAPYAEVALRKLYEFIGDDVIAFHNAAFDWSRFLKPGFETIGLRVNNPVICTMVLSRVILQQNGYEGPYNLAALCEHFGSPIQGAHRAYNDARYTAALLKRLRSIAITSGMCPQAEIGGVQEEESRFADYGNIHILKISPWSKGKEERLYVRTTVADIYYDYVRNLWSVQRLRDGNQVDMGQWEKYFVHAMGIEDLGTWLDDHRPA